MKWLKKGLIYTPDGKSTWARHSALQPTPIFLSQNIFRVYVGFRDEKGVSKIGFVDVDGDNPSTVLEISEKPVLDIGIPGTFDDNGVVPTAIIEREGKLYLYYAGYQLVEKVRFLAFGGLAISTDGGGSFLRCSKAPILDRTDKELFFRVIHSIMFEGGVWRAWYGGGSQYVQGNTKSLPVYNIRYLESNDGISFEKQGIICVDIKGEDEHRVGRPYVIKEGRFYRMVYSVGSRSKGFRLGYAESRDGINWTRKDEQIGIDVSESGWDSQMICYPAVVKNCKDTVYMFYNGNNYGRTGFGYAVLEEW